MKNRSTKPNLTLLHKSLLRAELQVKEAQGQVKVTEAKSRIARQKHKQAKAIARLAKKAAKQSKAAFHDAESILEAAESRLKKLRKELLEAKGQKTSLARNGSTVHLQLRRKSRSWKNAAAKSRKKSFGQEQIGLASRPALKHHIKLPETTPMPAGIPCPAAVVVSSI
ncbi:MAG TPA: hypothetical protein VMZ27_02245 [Candidatus Saccharimonadales bacterium]|nr:hypothetical protein [Candidatus Saccharimonadales bacterium]